MDSTFGQATAIKQVDSHTYEAHFDPQWVIGTVPHGGYVTACFQSVVRKHYDTTLRRQNQPHTITLHLDFLRRTQTGLATFKVKDVKLGRQATTVHVSLSQDGREEVVGYFNNANMTSEAGRKEWPFVEFRRATTKIRSWFPRQGQHSQACLDMWYCFRDPNSRFTNESLGFVCDSFPQIIESYLLDNLDCYSVDFERRYSQNEQKKIMNHRARMWYPTLLLNLDIKKALPEEGVRWLLVRLQAKKINNGRYDLEVLALDESGELVAVSNHVCFAVGSERNTAARRKVGDGESKL